MLVFAAPVNESAFGNAELSGEASEADAVRAELDELLNDFFHANLSSRSLWPYRGHRVNWP